LLKRTDDFWTCSSQSGVASKLYFFLRCSRGGLLNSHMPSSPNTMGTAARNGRHATRTMAKRQTTCMKSSMRGFTDSGVRRMRGPPHTETDWLLYQSRIVQVDRAEEFARALALDLDLVSLLEGREVALSVGWVGGRDTDRLAIL